MHRLLARERRAQIDTPIVFLFAVVAGVLVLLVVGWFVLGQQESAGNERTRMHLRGVATAIDAAGSSTNVERNITLIGELRVVCDDTGLVLWYGREERLDIPSTIVFGAPSVSGVATIRSAPIGGAYRVGNAVFIESASALRTPLPTTESTIAPGAGTVLLNNIPIPYFSSALREGAEVSGSITGYACGLDQTIKRYRFVNHIQRERAQRIATEYAAQTPPSPCRAIYDDAPFAAIEGALSLNGETRTASNFGLEDAEAIVRSEGRIRALNEQLIRASCATVS